VAVTTIEAPDLGTETGMTIAEVAERLEISAHTLRYYERIGLLSVDRDGGGRRRYTETDLSRLVFITRLRSADLPIGRIQQYFALVAEGPHTEPARLAILEEHRDAIRSRLASLEDALATIEFKIARYGGRLTGCTPPG
jgi:DNA-binding transcriptional MerR regulator